MNTLKSDALLLLTAAIWGFAFVAQRMGMEHVGPYTFNAIRFALGSLVLVPLILISRRKAADTGKQKPSLKMVLTGGALAGGAIFMGASLQQVGLQYTTAGKAGFITGLYVVIVPILGLFWKQRPGAGTWVGAIIASIGLYLLSVTEDFTIAYGDLLVLIGAFFWAGHVLMLSWLSPKINPVLLACLQFAVCSVASFVVAFSIETVALAGIVSGAIPILYGGLLSVGIAYTLQVVAQKYAPPSHAAIILSLEAVFAAIGGWIILNEVMSNRGFAGCGLMLFGMLLSQLQSLIFRKKPRPVRQEPLDDPAR